MTNNETRVITTDSGVRVENLPHVPPPIGDEIAALWRLRDAALIAAKSVERRLTGDYAAPERGLDPLPPLAHVLKVLDGMALRLNQFAAVASQSLAADPTAAVLESAIGWLKRRRDECQPASEAWIALDGALDDMRDHFYAGTPLDEYVLMGPWAEVER